MRFAIIEPKPMIRQMLQKRREARHVRRFFSRYAGRTLIIHKGLAVDWLDEMFKVGGGGAHFRLNVDRPPGPHPSAVEWLAHNHIVPLNLPMPLLCVVYSHHIDIRHLRTGAHTCHPGEIGWILNDMRTRHRRHAVLTFEPRRIQALFELSVDDNRFEIEFGES